MDQMRERTPQNQESRPAVQQSTSLYLAIEYSVKQSMLAAVRTIQRTHRRLVNISIETMTTTNTARSTTMGFRQLFDNDSSTYTYLLWDTQTKQGVVVDPVDTQADRDYAEAKQLGLTLLYGINTHAHADHITGTHLLKQKIEGFQSVISEASKAVADIKVKHGDQIKFGGRHVEVRSTPGRSLGRARAMPCNLVGRFPNVDGIP